MNLIPRVSEKTYASAATGTYVFNVPMTANKHQVIAAVKKQYGVDVVDARMVVLKGKAIRSSRGKRQQPAAAKRKDTKKVYVRLVEGATLDIFKEEEKK